MTGRGGRLSSPGGAPQRQAGCWHSLARVWGGKQGAPRVPSEAIEAPRGAATSRIWGAFKACPMEGGRFGGCHRASPRSAGWVLAPMQPTPHCRWGLWVPWAPRPTPQGGFLPLERGKTLGLAPTAPAAGSPLGGSAHPVTFAKRKNSINSSRQIKYK